jgi:hypothetical protein
MLGLARRNFVQHDSSLPSLASQVHPKGPAYTASAMGARMAKIKQARQRKIPYYNQLQLTHEIHAQHDEYLTH